MVHPPTHRPPRHVERRPVRSRKLFVWGTEALITGLGLVAILGPEADELVVTKVLGVLVMLVAFLGLFVGVLNPLGPGRRLPILAWTVMAFITGAVVQWVPAPGIPSLGSIVGLLLVGHGLTATSVAARYWKTWGLGRASVGLAAILLLLVGFAFVSGKDAGDRIDEIVLGVDIVLFGATLIVGRMLIEARSPTPDPHAHPESRSKP